MWIVRHGNRHDFVYPQWFNYAEKKYDPPLSEDGIIQAKAVAKRLENEPIKHIFLFSFFYEPSKLLTPLRSPLIYRLKLNQDWENGIIRIGWIQNPLLNILTTSKKKYLDVINLDYQPQIYPQYPETLEEIYQRTAQTTKILMNYHNPLIVGHSVAIQGMIGALLGHEHQPITIPLCSLSKLRYIDDKWQWELKADTSHLSHLPPPIIAH